MRLRDRKVFVTGGSRGIGSAIALACAREGADVIILAKGGHVPTPAGSVFDVAREIEAMGRRALALEVDISDAAAAERAMDTAIRAFGRVDILVNNAGAFWTASVVETPLKRFDLVMNVNLRAAFVLSRAVLPQMIHQHYGHIVMVSPPLDLSELEGHGAFALSKLGMTVLAQTICAEVAQQNVVAHALWPSTPIETPTTESFRMGGPEASRKPAIMADALVALVAREPSSWRGRAWLDEEVLAREGVTDFSGYQCLPGLEAPKFTRSAPPAGGSQGGQGT